uniref:RRM domain-containing protein n=1 Tax=Macrostomum lignano TaxID=282301 RepID=A0A1I8GZA5_9PLAT
SAAAASSAASARGRRDCSKAAAAALRRPGRWRRREADSNSGLPTQLKQRRLRGGQAETWHLWIAGLPPGTKATDAKELCSAYGRVVNVKIVGSKKSEVPAIFAFVTMDSAANAAKALQALDTSRYRSAELRVRLMDSNPLAKSAAAV